MVLYRVEHRTTVENAAPFPLALLKVLTTDPTIVLREDTEMAT
jgi:hypothetical protein